MSTVLPDTKDVQAKALNAFDREFNAKATICACAPGRVNLIGEHTDYNEGFVLPMALPAVTVMVGKPNGTKTCRLVSMSESISSQSKVEFEITEQMKPGEPQWANYVKGCIAGFIVPVPGFDAAIVSSVPVGAGLSSSAALEVATFTFLESLTGKKPEQLKDKALACQRAEHDFAGVPCGIMDQFISIMGIEGHALLLDCRDLIVKQIPMHDLGDFVFLITNSNVPHKLSSSAYCERRDCCFEAAKMLNKKSLRDVTINDIEGLKTMNVTEVMTKRARHVVSEIQRTLEAATALEQGDFTKFGKLMNESHNSLRDDYQVSSEELDVLVNTAREVDGVLGSRLTGAGFGGCTVTLLKLDAVEKVIQLIKDRYKGTPTFYIAKPSAGAREMAL